MILVETSKDASKAGHSAVSEDHQSLNDTNETTSLVDTWKDASWDSAALSSHALLRRVLAYES